MDRQQTPPPHQLRIRCPRLGHDLDFSYCRRENRGLPCHRALACWQDRFPVADHLRAELSEEEWRRAFETPPTPKILSLVELIEQAQKNRG